MAPAFRARVGHQAGLDSRGSEGRVRLKPNRILAVDWSGAARGARRKIWLCEAARGEVRRLENGRARDQIAEHLIAEAERDPNLVAGLDFAFSFPRGFLEKRAHKRVETVWEEAERLGEKWLAHCPFPFWGKPGRKKPPLGDLLHRQTELKVARQTGLRPLSVYQIGGAGVVGVGSIRGMPILGRLRAAGFAIWPFHPPRLPMVVEIWPRLFIGRLTKSAEPERRRFVSERAPGLDGKLREAAAASDDAFDALVSALEMDRWRAELGRLAPARNRAARLEGEIWRPPASTGSHPS